MKMNLPEKLSESLQNAKATADKYSPQISAVAMILFFGYSVYKTYKITPKLNKELEEKKKELNTEKLPIKEAAVIVAKNGIAPIGSFAAGTGIAIKQASKTFKLQNNYVNLATEYSLARAFIDDYKAQVVETIGEKKAEKIQYAYDQKQIDKNPPVVGVNTYEPKDDGNYKTLIYEPISRRYFWDKPDNFDAYVGRAQRLMAQSYNGELSAYDWLSLLPKEILDTYLDSEIDMLQHKVWTRDVPYEGFDAHLGESFTINDQNNKWYGYSCRRIEYGDEPVPYY